MPDAPKTSADSLAGLATANSASSRLAVPEIPLTPMPEAVIRRLAELGTWNETANADMQKWREQLIVALDKLLSDTEKNTVATDDLVTRMDAAEADITTVKANVSDLTTRVEAIETLLGITP